MTMPGWCPGGGYTWGVSFPDRAPRSEEAFADHRQRYGRFRCPECGRWLRPVLDQARTVYRMPAHRPWRTGRTPTWLELRDGRRLPRRRVS